MCKHFKRAIKEIERSQCVVCIEKQITELSKQLDIIVVGITSIYSVKLEESSTVDHVMLSIYSNSWPSQWLIRVLSLARSVSSTNILHGTIICIYRTGEQTLSIVYPSLWHNTLSALICVKQIHNRISFRRKSFRVRQRFYSVPFYCIECNDK